MGSWRRPSGYQIVIDSFFRSSVRLSVRSSIRSFVCEVFRSFICSFVFVVDVRAMGRGHGKGDAVAASAANAIAKLTSKN